MKNELTMIENELVPVYETSTGEKVVYGTELHEVLGVKSRFNDWVRNRLNDCEAVEKEDFESFTKNLVSGGQSKEYIIKLDTAKEMAMLERNEQGKKVRRYFIKIEKKYKANYDDLSAELKAVIIVDKRITKVESKVDTVKQELEDFKQDLPILGLEEGQITAEIRKKGVSCLGGKNSNAYHDRSLRTKLYSNLHIYLRQQFNVSTYKAIKRKQCDTAKEIIAEYKPPYYLQEQINDLNAQENLELV